MGHLWRVSWSAVHVADLALGIDYGTSSTVAMMRWPDGRVRQLLVDGAGTFPSAVYALADGRLLVGRDAERSARLDPAGFEPNPKSRIDEGEVLLGSRTFDVAEVMAATLRRVAEQAARAGGRAPSTVTLTFPAAWQRPRQAVLRAAAERAGMPDVRLVAEPVAAGWYYASTLAQVPPGRSLLVYDLGAGTFDASLLRATGDGFEVLAAGGLASFGGLDLDALIVEQVGAALAASDPEAWQRLRAPETVADRRHHRLFWDDARSAKESLSQRSSAGIPVPIVDRDVHLSREAFEQAAAAPLTRTLDEVARLMATAGVTPADLAAVLPVGGGTRMPLVVTMLHRRFGVAPTVVEQPELVVAEGALFEGATRPPQRSAVGVATVAPAPPVDPVSGVPGPVSGPPTPAAPVSAQPVSAQPVSAQPVSAQPVSAQPVSAQPFSAQPYSAQPASPLDEDSPVSVLPVSVLPVSSHPVSGQPFAAPQPGPGPATMPPAAMPPPTMPPPTPPAARSRRTLVAVVSAVVVLAVVAAAVFLINRRDSPDEGQNAGGGIESREADAEPLTLDELFPADAAFADAADRSYVVLGSDATDDCTSAARDQIVILLEQAGCGQVVRATMLSPGGRLALLTGVFNLTDSAAAQQMKEQAVPALENGDGGLAGMEVDAPAVDDGTGQRAQLTPHGHYLTYCLAVEVPDPPDGDDESATELCESVLDRLRAILDKRK